jgi:Bacterial Ig domain
VNTYTFSGSFPAVNRDGTLFVKAFDSNLAIFGRNYNAVENLSDLGGGFTFDPSRDVLLAVDYNSDQVIAYDTVTWNEKYRVDIGENVGGGNIATTSADGNILFLTSPAGVRRIDLPIGTGAAASFGLSYSHYIAANATGALTLTVKDQAGNVATGYRGTVHFSSSDLSASLPADFTFSAADAGVHTFEVALQTVGTQSVTATDSVAGVAGSLGNIAVHANPTTLVPVTNVSDLVYDPVHEMLVIATTIGTVERFDVGSQTLLPSIHAATGLNGTDVTPDGAFLYATDGQFNVKQGFIRKINLTTGQVIKIGYDLGGMEGAPWDIAIGSGGLALFDGRFRGSGTVPLRQLDLSTDAIAQRSDQTAVQQDTFLARAADRSFLMLEESNSSNGPIVLFNAAANAFLPGKSTWSFPVAQPVVNRDGTLFAMRLGGNIAIFDRNYQAIENIAGLDGGMAFDPAHDLFFAVDSAANQIVAFDTVAWQERFRINVGEDVGANGAMVLSGDGQRLYLATASGVRQYLLPQSDGVAARADFTYPRFIRQGVAATLTLTIRDAAGVIATGYRGTVRFASNDAAAGLPADYTFVVGDVGVHQFAVTLNTPGTRSISVTDTAVPTLSAGQININVHNGSVSVIPVTNGREFVFDSLRRQLLITTSAGTLERYDFATQTLLPPIKVATTLNAGDITPDGQFFYAADGQRNVVQSFVRKINLNTGQVTKLRYDLGALEGGGWDLAIANNGLAFFDGRFEGSGSVGLRKIDLATDTITIRAGVEQDTFINRDVQRSTLFLLQNNISSGPISVYYAANNSFSPPLDLGGFLSSTIGAVSPGGGFVAYNFGNAIRIRDNDLALVTSLGVDGGSAFNPVMNQLAVADPGLDNVVLFDTSTWTQTGQFTIGENLGSVSPMGQGAMQFSDDGTILALATSSGIRLYNRPVPPTDVALSGSVAEGAPVNSVVGTLISTDANANESFTYTLVAGAGSTDNALFSIVGNQLRTNVTFDFETQASYSIRVRTTDSTGLTFEKQLTVAITNVDPSVPIDTNPAANLAVIGAANGTPIGIQAAATDPVNTPLTYSLTNDAGGRFTINGNSGIVTIANTGLLTGAGPQTITVQASDGHGGTSTQSFSIDVVFPNMPPENHLPDRQSVREDVDLVLSSGLGNAVTVSDVDAGADSICLALTATHGVLTLSNLSGLSFSVGDGIADTTMAFTGTVTAVNNVLDGMRFRPNADYFGAAMLTFDTNDLGHTGAGGPQSDNDVLAINVLPVNDPPSFVIGANISTLENAAPFAQANWATGLSVGPANESNQTASFLLSNDNGSLFAVPPAIAADGSLSFTLQPEHSGVATVTVMFRDDGGTDNGGTDSVTHSFIISVAPYNRPPVNHLPAPQTVHEDSSLVFAPALGNAVSLTDVDAGANSLRLTLAVTNGALTLGATAGLAFAIGDGTADAQMTFVGTLSRLNAALNGLRFRPDADFFGAAALTMTTNDLGNSGYDGPKNDSDVLAIDVLAVNDAPSFVKGADPTVLEDAGPQQISHWATGLSVGPTNESVQTATFTVIADQPDLFADLPRLTPDGTLTFTPQANLHGTATLSVHYVDDGGVALGGMNEQVQSFTITILSVNDPVVFSKPENQVILQNQVNLVIPLSVSDVDREPLLYSARISASSVLFVLDRRLGLNNPGHHYFFNLYHRAEKWLRGRNNRWYALLPTGSLYALNSRAQRSALPLGKLIAQLDPVVYKVPALLYNAALPLPQISANFANGVLTLSNPTRQTGVFNVQVTVSDGIDTKLQSFQLVVVPHRALPQTEPVPPPASLVVELPPLDIRGRPVTYTVHSLLAMHTMGDELVFDIGAAVHGTFAIDITGDDGYFRDFVIAI